MRAFGSTVLLFAALVGVACGGSVSGGPGGNKDGGGGGGSGSGGSSGGSGGSGGGGGGSSGGNPSADGGTNPCTIPDVPVYDCAPVLNADAGCPPAQGSSLPGDGEALYPVGCNVSLPQVQAGCAGSCCGPQQCICQNIPGRGSAFVCPL